MSTNDDEPSVEEVTGVRGREIIPDDPDNLPWEVVIDGSQCPACGEFGRSRVVKQYPSGKPHPRPYRHFTCTCGKHWKKTIPENQLVKRRN